LHKARLSNAGFAGEKNEFPYRILSRAPKLNQAVNSNFSTDERGLARGKRCFEAVGDVSLPNDLVSGQRLWGTLNSKGSEIFKIEDVASEVVSRLTYHNCALIGLTL